MLTVSILRTLMTPLFLHSALQSWQSEEDSSPQGRERGRAQVSGSVLGAWWRCEMISSLRPRVSAPDGQISLPEPAIWK